MGPRYVLKVELIGFAKELDFGCERKKRSRTTRKGSPERLPKRNCRLGEGGRPSSEWEKNVGP